MGLFGWFRSIAHAVRHAFHRAFHRAYRVFHGVTSFFRHAASRARHVVSAFRGFYHHVRHKIHNAFHHAFNRIRSYTHAFVSHIHKAVHNMVNGIRRAGRRISHWFHRTAHNISRSVGRFYHNARNLVSSAVSHVRNYVHRIVHHFKHIPKHIPVRSTGRFIRHNPWVVPAVATVLIGAAVVGSGVGVHGLHGVNGPNTPSPGIVPNVGSPFAGMNVFNPITGNKDNLFWFLMGMPTLSLGAAGVYLWKKYRHMEIVPSAYTTVTSGTENYEQKMKDTSQLNAHLDPYYWYLKGKKALIEAREKWTEKFPEWYMGGVRKNANELTELNPQLKPFSDFSLKITETNVEAVVGIGEFFFDLSDLAYTAVWMNPTNPVDQYVMAKNSMAMSASIRQVIQNPSSIGKAIENQVGYITKHPVREGVHYAFWVLLSIATMGAGAEGEGAEVEEAGAETEAATGATEGTIVGTSAEGTEAGAETGETSEATGVDSTDSIVTPHNDIISEYTDPKGRVVRLYKGTETKGFTHIKARHGEDFERAFGVSKDEIPKVLNDAFKKGKIVREFIKSGKPTAILDYKYKDKTIRIIYNYATGEIITAYPLTI